MGDSEQEQGSGDQGDGTTVEITAPQGDVNVGGGTTSPDADAGDGK